MFVGRRKELAILGEEFGSSRASLAIVYGRRRVGKSTLIREAIKDHPHIFYQATRVTSSLNLDAFKAEIVRALGADELLTGITDWLAVLHYLSRVAEHRRGSIVVLDEFPYLIDTEPALPSIIRSSQHLNNIIEQDDRAIKRRCSWMTGFKSASNATITISGIELAHRIRKRQFSFGPGTWKRHWSLKKWARALA